jgi:hypothetical protein
MSEGEVVRRGTSPRRVRRLEDVDYRSSISISIDIDIDRTAGHCIRGVWFFKACHDGRGNGATRWLYFFLSLFIVPRFSFSDTKIGLGLFQGTQWLLYKTITFTKKNIYNYLNPIMLHFVLRILKLDCKGQLS